MNQTNLRLLCGYPTWPFTRIKGKNKIHKNQESTAIWFFPVLENLPHQPNSEKVVFSDHFGPHQVSSCHITQGLQSLRTDLLRHLGSTEISWGASSSCSFKTPQYAQSSHGHDSTIFMFGEASRASCERNASGTCQIHNPKLVPSRDDPDRFVTLWLSTTPTACQKIIGLVLWREAQKQTQVSPP